MRQTLSAIGIMLLSSLPALAGTVTITITTANGSRQNQITVPDPVIARVMTAFNTGGLTNSQIADQIASTLFTYLFRDFHIAEVNNAGPAAVALPTVSGTGTGP